MMAHLLGSTKIINIYVRHNIEKHGGALEC